MLKNRCFEGFFCKRNVEKSSYLITEFSFAENN